VRVQEAPGFALLDHRAQLDAYVFDRGLIDLLREIPGVVVDPAELVAILPKLTSRVYTISSSPLAHSGQVHTTVAVVRYSSHNRARRGVCPALFADRAAISDRLRIYTPHGSLAEKSSFARNSFGDYADTPLEICATSLGAWFGSQSCKSQSVVPCAIEASNWSGGMGRPSRKPCSEVQPSRVRKSC
jgi:hypothetical protein